MNKDFRYKMTQKICIGTMYSAQKVRQMENQPNIISYICPETFSDNNSITVAEYVDGYNRLSLTRLLKF